MCSVTFSLQDCFSYSAVHLTQGTYSARRMMGAGLNWLRQAAAGHRLKTGVLLAGVLLGCLEHLPELFPLFCLIGDIAEGPEKRPVGCSAPVFAVPCLPSPAHLSLCSLFHNNRLLAGCSLEVRVLKTHQKCRSDCRQKDTTV